MARVALVVDDSMLIRHTVCRYLEQRGFEVESATNGLEALNILNTVLPDVIITDMAMPKMEGTEFISRLKAQPKTARIPVVVIASRRGRGTLPDGRANSVIYKDTGIESQLGQALLSVIGDCRAC